MTKDQLATENRRLREENKGLRDLLAAVSLAAGTVPTADGAEPEWKELRRAVHVLSGIKVAADPGGSWAWGHATGEAAKFLRERAAEPVGYEVYEPAQDETPASVTA